MINGFGGVGDTALVVHGIDAPILLMGALLVLAGNVDSFRFEVVGLAGAGGGMLLGGFLPGLWRFGRGRRMALLFLGRQVVVLVWPLPWSTSHADDASFFPKKVFLFFLPSFAFKNVEQGNAVAIITFVLITTSPPSISFASSPTSYPAPPRWS